MEMPLFGFHLLIKMTLGSIDVLLLKIVFCLTNQIETFHSNKDQS